MTFGFLPHLPDGMHQPYAVVPERKAAPLPFSEYLVVQKEQETHAFEIRYEQHCGPFKEAAFFGDLLAVGLHGHFYLYNHRTKQTVSAVKMNGYFGHFYGDQHLVFIADACGLHCITKEGIVLWYRDDLGVDGVTVEKITEDKIYGSGEQDPPGGWRDFVLDKQTGRPIG